MYDQDGNNLIDRKAAEVHKGEPVWLVDGRFYDVGRNPDPTPGNAKTDYGDYRCRVTHIKFDTSPDVGAGDEPGEGLQLDRGWLLRSAHVDDGRAKGEWIYKWAEYPHAGRHEPALYACKETIQIQVRIECANAIASAHVGAREVVAPGEKPQWRDVAKTHVEFVEKIAGKLWVSKGPPLDPNDPAAGNSEYVTMQLVQPIRNDINKSLCTWQWYVDGTSSAGTPPGTPCFAKDVCKNKLDGWEINRSEGYVQQTDDKGNTIDVPVPHTFYTVLGKPTDPWYREFVATPNQLVEAFPWVEAMEFAIIQRVRLEGLADPDLAASKVADFCYSGYGQKYDHVKGSSMWVAYGGKCGEVPVYSYEFANYVSAGDGGIINCYDQACSVTTLITLMTGLDAQVAWLVEFGYVHKAQLVGGVDTNNPFWGMSNVYVPDKVVDADDTMWRLKGALRKRSTFQNHTWCEVSGGKLYDATVGENDSPYIFAGRSDYRNAACDVSKTGGGIDWRDDEKVPAKRDVAWNVPAPYEPWLDTGYTDTVYAISTSDDFGNGAQSVEHANMARVRLKKLNLR
ncbi:MAG: hypothetical protein IT464_00560 [Planctomycetes bacterium]|nr:hypothetical protein [Planctomycetota bacterium]